MTSIIQIERNMKGKWEKEYNFWNGDLRHIDLSVDPRFKEVTDKRRNAVLRGTLTNDPVYPIVFPFTTDTGEVINRLN